MNTYKITAITYVDVKTNLPNYRLEVELLVEDISGYVSLLHISKSSKKLKCNSLWFILKSMGVGK